MATLWVTEYVGPSRAPGSDVQVPLEPSSVTQVVTFTTSAATTNPFRDETTIIRIYASAACHYKIANSPTATTNDTPLAAGVPEYVGVPPGGTLKIAAVTA